jgi:SAM-dependent methyltransferase
MESEYNYQFLSPIYDDCKSTFWDSYSLHIRSFLGNNPIRILDLGCGTGLAIKYLNCRSDNYVGVDSSPQMLEVAKRKYPNYEFYLGSIQNINFSDRFDLVLAAFDTLNHLLSPEDWKSTFWTASNHMTENSLFIFDVVTPYDHEFNWPGHLDVTESDEWLYFQRSDFNKEIGRAFLKTTIFKKEKCGWGRYDETIEQISLPIEKIQEMLSEVGLKSIHTLDLISGEKPIHSSGTILLICKKFTK